MLGDRHSPAISDIEEEDAPDSDDERFLQAVLTHKARPDEFDMTARDDGDLKHIETPFNKNAAWVKQDDETVKPLKYNDAITAKIKECQAAAKPLQNNDLNSGTTTSKSLTATPRAKAPVKAFKTQVFQPPQPTKITPGGFLPASHIASSFRQSTKRGRANGKGRGGAGTRGRGGKAGVMGGTAAKLTARNPASKTEQSTEARSSTWDKEELEKAKREYAQKKAPLPTALDLFKSLESLDQEEGKGKGKAKGKAKFRSTTAKAKAKANGKAATADSVVIHEEGIELLSSSDESKVATKPTASAKRKAVAPKAAPAPKKGGKKKKETESVTFGLIPKDVNTNDKYPLTAAIIRQRALPARKTAAYESDDEAESGPSNMSRAEKGRLATARLMEELLPEGTRPAKKRKKEDDTAKEASESSEGGRDSIDPEADLTGDHDDSRVQLGGGYDKEEEGRVYVMSRYFHPETVDKAKAIPTKEETVDLTAPSSMRTVVLDSPSRSARGQEQTPDLKRPIDIERYVANDPIAAEHDNSSSILPYSSPIDRRVRRQDSSLLHPRPVRAWPNELEKLKKVAAQRGAMVERAEEERRSAGKEEDKAEASLVPQRGFASAAPPMGLGRNQVNLSQRYNYVPPAKCTTLGNSIAGFPRQPRANGRQSGSNPAKESLPEEGEWSTLPSLNKSGRRSIGGNIAGFGDVGHSGSSKDDKGSSSAPSGLRTGRKLFKPSQIPSFQTAPESRPVFRSSASSRLHPVSAMRDDDDHYNQPGKYDPLQQQMQRAAARAEQDDVMGYRYELDDPHHHPDQTDYHMLGIDYGLTSHSYDPSRPRALPALATRDLDLARPSSHPNRPAERFRSSSKPDDDEGDAWEDAWKPRAHPQAGPSRLESIGETAHDLGRAMTALDRYATGGEGMSHAGGNGRWQRAVGWDTRVNGF